MRAPRGIVGRLLGKREKSIFSFFRCLVVFCWPEPAARPKKINFIFFVPQSPTSLGSGVAEGPTGLRRLAAPLQITEGFSRERDDHKLLLEAGT